MQTIDVQLSPFGEYVCHDGTKENDGKKQIVDETAVDNLVYSFDKEVLVDLDHRSLDGSSTEAAAWVTKVWKDAEKGLMGTFRLTGLGEEVISDERYKFLSPSWELDETRRPYKLISVGLTNVPNLPVRKVASNASGDTPLHFVTNALHFYRNNSDAQVDEKTADASKGRFSHDSEGDVSEGNSAPDEEILKNQERNPNMDKLKEILGLAPEATEDDIAGAVTALKDECDALKAAKADADAEEFANSCAEQCEDKEVLKNAYKANPELARTIVANMKKIAPVPVPEMAKNPVCNSAVAKAPTSLKTVAVSNADLSIKERIAANRKLMHK